MVTFLVTVPTRVALADLADMEEDVVAVVGTLAEEARSAISAERLGTSHATVPKVARAAMVVVEDMGVVRAEDMEGVTVEAVVEDRPAFLAVDTDTCLVIAHKAKSATTVSYFLSPCFET